MSSRPEPTKDGPQGPQPTPPERVEDDDQAASPAVPSRDHPRDAVHDPADTGPDPKAKPDPGQLPDAREGNSTGDPFAPNGEPRPSRFHVPG